MSAGLTDDEFTAVENSSPTRSQTDDKGHADLSVDLPDGDGRQAARGEAHRRRRRSRAAARSSASSTLPVRAKGAMIGVKKDFDDLGEGDDRDLRDDRRRARRRARRAQGRRAGRSIKLTNDYQWFNSDGRWSFEPVKSSKRIADGTIDIGADAPAKITAQVGWGRHRLDVKIAPTANRPASPSTSAGRGAASADTPDNVAVTLDKASYAPGEKAKLRIASRFARQGDGRAGRRQARAIHRRRSRRGRQRRAVPGRRATGARAPMRSR